MRKGRSGETIYRFALGIGEPMARGAVSATNGSFATLPRGAHPSARVAIGQA
jgi:hypothetical protein